VIDSSDRVKCLIVEQHEPTLEALEFALRAADREVFTATTAADALNLSREHDFAFVLIDVQVPTLDGYALAEMMRGVERSSATPIIFMATAGPNEPPPVFAGSIRPRSTSCSSP
jgi:DNA-binding response OmpR family regulator